jgi:hypothetical protein
MKRELQFWSPIELHATQTLRKPAPWVSSFLFSRYS